jgi:hypothetical protein
MESPFAPVNLLLPPTIPVGYHGKTWTDLYPPESDPFGSVTDLTKPLAAVWPSK